MSEKPKMLSVNETAEALNVSSNHVRNMLKKNQIRAVKIGGVVRIPETEVDRFIGEPNGAA